MSILDDILDKGSKGLGVYFLARRAEAENEAIKNKAEADRLAAETELTRSKATTDTMYKVARYAMYGAGLLAMLAVLGQARRMWRAA